MATGVRVPVSVVRSPGSKAGTVSIAAVKPAAALLKRDVAHVRRVDRLDAAFLQRLFNRPWDEAVQHFVEDLFAEPLLDDRRGNLARPEPWDLDLLKALRNAIDLCVDNGAVDLDGDRLLGFADVGELCLHSAFGPTGKTGTQNDDLASHILL